MIWFPFLARRFTTGRPRKPEAPNTVTTFPEKEARPPAPFRREACGIGSVNEMKTKKTHVDAALSLLRDGGRLR